MKWFITDMDGTFLNDKKEVAPTAQVYHSDWKT